jgi:hypothetical protein
LRNAAEVSSGRSSWTIMDDRLAKDQRSGTRQRLLVLGAHEACVKREVSIGA